ncbi:MAG TPA: DUF4097 family beta strand repeat-containing protein [Symbiobacteriaceae bacterium]|jgi:hypothetical protein
MTQDERVMILQMVAEKKISVNDAVELLKAIAPADQEAPGFGEYAGSDPVAESGSPAPGAAPGTTGTRPAGTPGGGPGPGARRTYSSPPPPPGPNFGSGFGAGFGAGFGSGLSSFIDEVIDRASSVFGDAFGHRYEFPTELTGDFTEGEIPLRIATGNGRVDIQTWDEPGYKATVLVKARGSSEEDARNRAQDAYSVKADGTCFELEARRSDVFDVAVHVSLLVPRDRTYRLETRTGNGHIEVINMPLRDGQITTGNGRVTCRGGRADALRLQSGNGAVEVELEVADLEAGTGNGSLEIRTGGAQPQDLRLSTGNGSIRVDTSRLPAAAGFRIEATSAMGGLDVSLPNLVYEQDNRAMGHKRVVAFSQNFGQTTTPVTIKARTGMGSISVS